MSAIKKILSKENLKSTLGNMLESHRRFPLTLISALAFASLLVYSIAMDTDEVFHSLVKAITTCVLGIPLFFSLELLAERRWWSKSLLLLSGVAILLLYYLTADFDPDDNRNTTFLIRFIGLVLVFHLMVSVLPYLKLRDEQKFWNFNKTIFLSILTSVLYSATLLAGLNLAILAIDQLFEANINGKVYGYVGVFIGGYINTVLFANNIPKLNKVDSEFAYPKGLKLFTQYVLLPLVAIYLMILLSYEAKILFQWELPKGWVSNLVLASGVFGVLAFLLLYPIKNSSSWVGRYNRFYYWILLPLIALMMVAIYVRINQYGVTEPRYFVAILACWLLGISLYFIFSSKDEIRWIPLSLIGVTLLALFGPLSSISVSERNQERRMQEVLKKYELVSDGKLVMGSGKKLERGDADKLSAGLDYLSRRKPDVVSALLSEELHKEFEEVSEYDKKNRIWEWLALENTAAKETLVINVYRRRGPLEKAFNADYILEIYPNGKNWSATGSTDELEYKVTRLSDSILKLEVAQDELIFDFSGVNKLTNEVETEKMTFESVSSDWRGVLVLNSFYKSGSTDFANLDGKIYLIRKGD